MASAPSSGGDTRQARRAGRERRGSEWQRLAPQAHRLPAPAGREAPAAGPPLRGPLPPRAGRVLALSALGLVVLIVAYLLFAGGGGANYQLIFGEAGQLVRGDQVQVGGVPVGSVTGIALTHDYKAKITIHVNSSLTPLHEGTVAQVRVPSLSTVANRYIALTPGPNSAPALPAGATLPASATREVVDLDQLFNTLNPEDAQVGLQQVIQGFAEQYAGAQPRLGVPRLEYTPAALAGDRPPLLRAHPRPAGVHQLPRGNRQGRHHDRRALGTARPT